MKVTRRRIIAGIGVVVLVAVAAVSPRVLRRIAFFRVRQVEVVGAQYLDEADVARRLALRPDASTFDRLAAVRSAAAAIPGVLDATVDRRLPGTLRVTVREAVPVALVDQRDQLMLMDSAGRVLPFDPTRSPASLPIAMKDSAVAALLGRLKHDDRWLFDNIDGARIDRGDVVLELGARRIRLRPEADSDAVHAVSAVISYLNKRAIAWREIDARYHNRVFVQQGTA